MDGRFEVIDRRFEAVDRRFEAVRFVGLDQRLDTLITEHRLGVMAHGSHWF